METKDSSSSHNGQDEQCCNGTSECICSACLLCLCCPLAILWCCIKLPCQIGWRAARRVVGHVHRRSEDRVYIASSSFSDTDFSNGSRNLDTSKEVQLAARMRKRRCLMHQSPP
ncbi:hypothetical protein AAC387_Pa05g3164 [Persea americana]